MAVTNAMTQGRREKILERLNEGQATSRELEEACGASRGALRHLLRELESKDQITVVVPGSRSGPTEYALVDYEEYDEQEAEGISVADIQELERRAAAAEPKSERPSSALCERYIEYLVSEHPIRLVHLVLEGKIKATPEMLTTIEEIVLGTD